MRCSIDPINPKSKHDDAVFEELPDLWEPLRQTFSSRGIIADNKESCKCNWKGLDVGVHMCARTQAIKTFAIGEHPRVIWPSPQSV